MSTATKAKPSSSRRNGPAAAHPDREQGSQNIDQQELDLMDAYWRAANYLSVGQIYLRDNPLLRRPSPATTSSRACSVTSAPPRD